MDNAVDSQMYPPVEASGGQEQYYVRSAWHLQSCIRSTWHFDHADIPPSRGIWWARAVLHKVSLTFTIMHQGWLDILSMQMYPPVEASAGQEQYYVRSVWHLVMHQVNLTFLACRHMPSTGIWWPRAVLPKVILTFCRMQLRMQWTVRHIPITCIWWSRAVLHKVSLTFTVMHQVGLTFWACRCIPQLDIYSHASDQLDILFMQTYPPVEVSGGQEQYYIRSAWHLQSCIRVDLTFWACRCTSPVEASAGQEQYYVRSVWHLVMHQVNLTFEHEDIPPVQASGGQEQYYLSSSWHSAECNWECSGQLDIAPITCIWWSRAVLHKVSLTFTVMHQVGLTFWACRCTPQLDMYSNVGPADSSTTVFTR